MFENARGTVDGSQSGARLAQISQARVNPMVYVRWGACELHAQVPICSVPTKQ